ncbi:MAG: acetyl-CoA carboxylase biotin carboxyl carrier protein subunit [Prolixibacteraceae bacterium]|nr:acetyl-CoA carboxylase biotin carboxyl carrier protein subunit [Prolixibacteraceae bacterium]
MMRKKIKNNEQNESLVVQGARYETTLTGKFRNRKFWGKPNPNHIFSFIPGTVVDVLVKTGQRVNEGDLILVLEAMKMHNNIVMPFKGEIVKIHVKDGDIIPKNHLMFEVRPI